MKAGAVRMNHPCGQADKILFFHAEAPAGCLTECHVQFFNMP